MATRTITVPTTVATVAGQVVTSRSYVVPMRRVHIDVADVGKPGMLTKSLRELQDNIQQTLALLGLPFLGGVLFKGLAFTAGTPRLIAHQLGRAYQGYIATRVQAAASTSPYETSLPAGAKATQFVNLAFSANCTADVYVF
jgi:hypothetical protein